MVKTNTTTVTLAGVTAVQFAAAYPYFAVRNDGDDDIYVSTVSEACEAGTDGVVSVPSSGSVVIGRAVIGSVTDGSVLYLNGEGTATVMGQYDRINPFKSAAKGGGESYVLPTASADTLGGVKVGENLSITDGVLSATDTTYSAATTSADGLMSASDKTKLDGLSNLLTLVHTETLALSSTETTVNYSLPDAMTFYLITAINSGIPEQALYITSGTSGGVTLTTLAYNGSPSTYCNVTAGTSTYNQITFHSNDSSAITFKVYKINF